MTVTSGDGRFAAETVAFQDWAGLRQSQPRA